MLVRISPLILAGLGITAILILIGTDSLPIVAGWSLGILVVYIIWQQLIDRSQKARFTLSVCLILVCILLIWEGGSFFLPSAVALLILSLQRGKVLADNE